MELRVTLTKQMELGPLNVQGKVGPLLIEF